MARSKPFHFHQGLTAELRDVALQLKGIAAEFKATFHEARQHPTVKVLAHEARQTATDVKAVVQNMREDIKQVFKSAGEQISELFKDAGERLAAVNEQALAQQAARQCKTGDASAIAGDHGRVHDSSEDSIQAELTGLATAETAPAPIHG